MQFNKCQSCIKREIQKSLESWINTPFHPRAAIKCVGVDCVNLAFEVYKDAEIIPGFLSLPAHYPMDGGHHHTRCLILEFLQDIGGFLQVSKSEKYKTGDLLVFKLGRTPYHTGVVYDELHVIKAIQKSGVQKYRIDDPTIASRIKSVFRPTVLIDQEDREELTKTRKPCSCA